MTHDQAVTLVVFAGVILAVFVGLAIYDVVLLVRKGPEATFSRIAFEVSARYPVLPLAVGVVFGVLAGHILWPNC